ncbi:MAG: Omp28 family outer membrane lipoprotein [Bacteroidales bacterium]|jgi:thiol-disulfide isomerase/thioredoxin|nr:Omp28 family outer membrane lipoprotein [Bacteroidales bacterium]
MKLNFLKYFIPIVIVSLFVACDVIPENSYYTPIENPTVNANKRVALIEDFTGHKCPNCPKAAEESEKLITMYGSKVIVIAIHSGTFSTPVGQGFNTNYRTPEGNEIHNYFELQSYPKGLVNRTNTDGVFLLDYGQWEAKVAEIVEQDPQVKINFDHIYVYEGDSSTVRIGVVTNFVGEELIPSNLCAFIIESGMVSPQIDGTETIENYVHNHVLRTSFDESGAWGIELRGIGEETNIFNVTLNGAWVPENCEIVVYVYNTQTMEILQAAAHHVK